MKLLLFNLPQGFAKSFFEKTASIVLKGEKSQNKEIEVVFLSQAKIQKLNRQYLKRNRPTDVLSFKNTNSFPLEKDDCLGELAICLVQVKKNAAVFKESLKKEMARTLIHGILHLLGYNHGKGGRASEMMIAKQEKYLAQLN